MADMDLGSALTMFKEGAQQLSLSRALSQANDQVQQIKSSELNDQQQRQQLQQLSNTLVTHMAGIGIPATTIQAVAGAVGPKQYANSNDMYMQGALTGNQQLKDEANDVQEHEQNPAAAIAKIQAKADASNPMKMLAMQNAQDKAWSQTQQNLDKRLDTQATRFGNISKLQGMNNRIKDVMTQLEGETNPQKLHEMGRAFDSILSNGSATIEGSKSVLPSTLQEKIANAKQFITSRPANMNIDEFKQYYRDAFNRIQDVNGGIIKHAQADIVQSATGPAKMNPTAFETWAMSRGIPAKVDPKTGKVTVDKSEFDTPSQSTGPQLTPITVRKPGGGVMRAFKDAMGNLFSAD